MSRYNVTRQWWVRMWRYVAWAELNEGIFRSAVEVCEESTVRKERHRTTW